MTYVVEHPDFDLAVLGAASEVAVLMLVADGRARPHRLHPGEMDAAWRIVDDVAYLDCLWRSVPEHAAAFRFDPADGHGDYAKLLGALAELSERGANIVVQAFPDAGERAAAHQAWDAGDKAMFASLAIGTEIGVDCSVLGRFAALGG